MFVLDTNVLMHDPTAIFRFEEHDVFIPMIVLEELDAGKKGLSEAARNVRQVSRFLDELMQDATKAEIDHGLPLPNAITSGNAGKQRPSGRLFFQTKTLDSALPELPGHGADNAILGQALALKRAHTDTEVTLVSKDINLRIKAAILGVHAEDYFSDQTIEDADLLYTVLARRATFDPRSKKLTLEGVFPIVAAVKVGNGDGRSPTSLKAEGKDHECSAQVAKTARRSSAARFFGDLFKRNGERRVLAVHALRGEREREKEASGAIFFPLSLANLWKTHSLFSLSLSLSHFLLNPKHRQHQGTWLNSPNALLMGTDSSRAGAELALRLSDVQYRSSASTVVFRAEQIDPTTVKESKGGEKSSSSPLRSSGGVVESWAALASSSGKWLDPKGSKVVLKDVILDVDAPYWRQEYQLKGFTEG